MSKSQEPAGHIRPAPENFLSNADIEAYRSDRRSFLRSGLALAGAAASAPLAAWGIHFAIRARQG